MTKQKGSNILPKVRIPRTLLMYLDTYLGNYLHQAFGDISGTFFYSFSLPTLGNYREL